jgi:hypothetical protein
MELIYKNINKFHFLLIGILGFMFSMWNYNNNIKLIISIIAFFIYLSYLIFFIYTTQKKYKLFSRTYYNVTFLIALSQYSIIILLLLQLYLFNTTGIDTKTNLEQNIEKLFLIMFYFIVPFILSKYLVSSEKNKVVTLKEHFADYIKFILFPICFWFLIPRINKLFENSIVNKGNAPK